MPRCSRGKPRREDGLTGQKVGHGCQRNHRTAVLHDPRDRPAIVSAFSGFRALCAVRAGPRGVEAINERMTRHARERLAPLLAALPTEAGPAWYAGRPVMVLRNV